METEFNVQINEYLPLRDVVFNTIREAILMGRLQPGERLMEKYLAEKIGVSRTPIREALRRLELEGLVEVMPRKGAQVAKISKKDIIDVLAIRAALESLAAMLSCDNITPEQLQQLKEARDNFKQSLLQDDVKVMAEKDEVFHSILFNSTNNLKLIHIINNLREQIYRYRYEYLKDKLFRDSIALEHDQLVGALINRDKQAASLVAQTHISNQEEAIIKKLK